MVNTLTSKKLLEASEEFYRTSQPFHPVNTSTIPLSQDQQEVIRNLFQHFDGICLAEFHESKAPEKFIIENLDFLQAQGVSTIFMEHFKAEHQIILDTYQKNQNDTVALNEMLKGSFHNVTIESVKQNTSTHVLKEAIKRNIRVVAIDNEAAVRAFERISTMNYLAQHIINKEKGGEKYLVYVGASHALTHKEKYSEDKNMCSEKLIPGLSEILQIPVIGLYKKHENTIERDVLDENSLLHFSFSVDTKQTREKSSEQKYLEYVQKLLNVGMPYETAVSLASICYKES